MFVCFLSQVLVAVHRIVLFDLTLEDERQVNERRNRARTNLSVLKLGVHRFLAMRAKRYMHTHIFPSTYFTAVATRCMHTRTPTTYIHTSTTFVCVHVCVCRCAYGREGA